MYIYVYVFLQKTKTILSLCLSTTFHGLKFANGRGSDFITGIQAFNTMVPKTHQACQKLLRFKSQPKESSERLRGTFKSLLANLKNASLVM